jgi:predicted transcriptional regulator
VPVKRSIHNEFIICLEDGKKLKMLKRHLSSRYSMTPDDYRKRWGLPKDYPMVAPAYAAQRSALAKEIGLGRKAAAPAPEPVPAKPVRRAGGRKKKVA